MKNYEDLKFDSLKEVVMKKIILTLVNVSLITGCTKLSDMEKRTKSMDRNTSKMQTTTEDMYTTTKGMSKTTDSMNETTQEMKLVTSTMYSQIRTKDTEETRARKVQDLFSDKIGMLRKLAAASIYFQSFEFQFWNNNKSYDTLETREKLFVDAANEFFRTLLEMTENLNTTQMSPTLRDPSTNNLSMAFYALAATMHSISHHQEAMYKSTGENFKKTSFYDLMISALTKDAKGEELTEAEAIFVTGKFKQISIELCKARVNILLGIATDSIADLDSLKKSSALNDINDLMVKLATDSTFAIALPSKFETSNAATRKDILTTLGGAIQARNFLKSLKIETQIDPLIGNILKNIQISQEANKDAKINAEVLTFKNALAKITGK